DKKIEEIKRSDTDISAQTSLQNNPPPGHLTSKVKNVLKKRDTIHAIVKAGNASLLKKKTPSRDSLRKLVEKKPHTRRQIIGKKKPITFFVPKELGPFIPPMIPWILL